MKTTVTLYHKELELLSELITQKNQALYEERSDYRSNNDHLPHREYEDRCNELDELFDLSWKLRRRIEEAYHRTFA